MNPLASTTTESSLSSLPIQIRQRDGRETHLFHQSVDATLGHAEGSRAPAAPLQKQIASFEGCTTALTPELCASIAPGEGLVTAQLADNAAGDLTAHDATGGPLALAQQIGGYYLCMNDPFGCDNQTFSPVIFTVYDGWANLTGSDPQILARQVIACGQQVFNSATFKITGVAGLKGRGIIPASDEV
jgi:hypothetical protein